jgi:hypothetical protein
MAGAVLILQAVNQMREIPSGCKQLDETAEKTAPGSPCAGKRALARRPTLVLCKVRLHLMNWLTSRLQDPRLEVVL